MYTLATVFVKFSCSTAFKSHGILSHFNFNHIGGNSHVLISGIWFLFQSFIRHLVFFFLLYCTFLLFSFQGFLLSICGFFYVILNMSGLCVTCMANILSHWMPCLFSVIVMTLINLSFFLLWSVFCI